MSNQSTLTAQATMPKHDMIFPLEECNVWVIIKLVHECFKIHKLFYRILSKAWLIASQCLVSLYHLKWWAKFLDTDWTLQRPGEEREACQSAVFVVIVLHWCYVNMYIHLQTTMPNSFPFRYFNTDWQYMSNWLHKLS